MKNMILVLPGTWIDPNEVDIIREDETGAKLHLKSGVNVGTMLSVEECLAQISKAQGDYMGGQTVSI